MSKQKTMNRDHYLVYAENKKITREQAKDIITSAEGSVLLTWVMRLPWKLQSILFSGLRGPDQDFLVKIKQVSKWLRMVTQNNADPSKSYMNNIQLPEPSELDKELEHCTCHFVHHFADALAIVAYYNPDGTQARFAALMHYHVAEEIFHFWPETPEYFARRHRDKRDGVDLDPGWEAEHDAEEAKYIERVLEFRKKI